MSFFLRSSRMPVCFAARPAQTFRAFSASRTLELKESDRHTENQGDLNEKHKQDLLKKQKEGKGHWKPELASDSEEAITADRHEHNDHSEEGIKDLQKKTVKYAEEKHKTGTSQDTGL